MALHSKKYDVTAIEQMRDVYIGKYENVEKVYVPMLRNDQWFLLVIDTTTPGSVTYMDSCDDPKERKARINQVNYAAYFLETILNDKQFFEHNYIEKSIISKFKFKEANPPHKEEGLNDSGVSIDKLMQLSYMLDDYLDEVNDMIRMTLALDLVMGKENLKADVVRAIAITTWSKLVHKAVSKNKRKKKKVAKKVNGQSPSISF
ncbi:hypothetical protein PIB30_042223 [Stylosanthes scabra]|uniref:Ubiquitin-like protease family profile domain-containing protein n=1 Tax=Stylosanthes scabra TaxID=79078 RepID=A0ABU6XG36_9FABA|nr:hypothetical protein [Stylosanthes scabra]